MSLAAPPLGGQCDAAESPLDAILSPATSCNRCRFSPRRSVLIILAIFAPSALCRSFAGDAELARPRARRHDLRPCNYTFSVLLAIFVSSFFAFTLSLASSIISASYSARSSGDRRSARQEIRQRSPAAELARRKNFNNGINAAYYFASCRRSPGSSPRLARHRPDGFDDGLHHSPRILLVGPPHRSASSRGDGEPPRQRRDGRARSAPPMLVQILRGEIRSPAPPPSP